MWPLGLKGGDDVVQSEKKPLQEQEDIRKCPPVLIRQNRTRGQSDCH